MDLFEIFLFQLLIDTGSHKLEDKYADFTVSPIHILQFSRVAVPPFKVITHFCPIPIALMIAPPIPILVYIFCYNNCNLMTIIQRRGWKMGCFRCSGAQTLLPSTFSG